MTKALDEVIAERQRQIDEEGHTLERDMEHNMPGELASAAAAYAAQVGTLMRHGDNAKAGAGAPSIWPFEPYAFKQTGYRRSLVKAAALLLAELERLDLEPESDTTA